MRNRDRHAARCGRGRHERDQPQHPAGPGREPAARQRVGAAAGRAARRSREGTPPKRGKHTNRPVRRKTSGGFCASRPSGRKRQRWTGTTRTSSGCSRSTDSRQPDQPDSVRGCTSRNAAGWPRRWRRCATTIEPKRRCPDRRGQRPGSVRHLGESRRACRCPARFRDRSIMIDTVGERSAAATRPARVPACTGRRPGSQRAATRARISIPDDVLATGQCTRSGRSVDLQDRGVRSNHHTDHRQHRHVRHARTVVVDRGPRRPRQGRRRQRRRVLPAHPRARGGGFLLVSSPRNPLQNR